MFLHGEPGFGGEIWTGAWFLHRMGPFRGETKVETQLLHEKNQFDGNSEADELLHKSGRSGGNFGKEGAGMRK